MPSHEDLIRAARARSNRGIAERNPHIVAESLDKDFLVIVGDGTFIPSREAYIAAFKAGFAEPAPARYERTPDIISVSTDGLLASEHGHWTATLPDGTVTHTGWKLRSELFVTLTQPS
jgi:hypothetical protein